MSSRLLVVLSLLVPIGVVTANAGEEPAVYVPKYRRPVILTLHEEITDVTYESIQRRMGEAEELGADLILLDIDSPGGAGKPMLDIC